MTAPRPLSVIAADVRQHWPRVFYAAEPYLRAMAELGTVTDTYGYESGASVVRYFLENARTWRGPHARRVKAELRDLVGP